MYFQFIFEMLVTIQEGFLPLFQGNTVGLADVVLWGSLYPILAEKNKFGGKSK